MQTNIPRQGNRVHVGGGVCGIVMGYGTSNGEPVAIVNIDDAEWTESRKMFITNIVVHVSNLEEIFNASDH